MLNIPALSNAQIEAVKSLLKLHWSVSRIAKQYDITEEQVLRVEHLVNQ